ncbi:MAG: hypothetical protein ACR2MS_07775 [Weeksellaceae bacterium]
MNDDMGGYRPKQQEYAMPLKIYNVKMIDESDWSKFVSETYDRPYRFQQQDGCRERGTYWLDVDNFTFEDDDEEYIQFQEWLKRDPNEPVEGEKEKDSDSIRNLVRELWWFREFYPSIEIIATDLYQKGLLEEGQYMINIDW